MVLCAVIGIINDDNGDYGNDYHYDDGNVLVVMMFCLFRQTTPTYNVFTDGWWFSILLQLGLGESRNRRRQNTSVRVYAARSALQLTDL